jgi:hypothetical protein
MRYQKILPFTKFIIKNVLGDFEMDPLAILDRDAKNNLRNVAIITILDCY